VCPPFVIGTIAADTFAAGDDDVVKESCVGAFAPASVELEHAAIALAPIATADHFNVLEKS